MVVVYPSTPLGLGRRHWNLETSSVVVEFPPPYLLVSFLVYSIVALSDTQQGWGKRKAGEIDVKLIWPSTIK